MHNSHTPVFSLAQNYKSSKHGKIERATTNLEEGRLRYKTNFLDVAGAVGGGTWPYKWSDAQGTNTWQIKRRSLLLYHTADTELLIHARIEISGSESQTQRRL